MILSEDISSMAGKVTVRQLTTQFVQTSGLTFLYWRGSGLLAG